MLLDWFEVSFDETTVTLDVTPTGSPAWRRDFRWESIVRVCFKSELDVSDGIYVFVAGRAESFAIPTCARGGAELWSEILRRELFDAKLAIRVASTTDTLGCWPLEDAG